MDLDLAIASLAFEEGRRLGADPNIAAVGYGPKLKQGAPGGPLSLHYYVRRKLRSLAELQAHATWPVPSHVQGYPTDVIETGSIARASADRQAPAGDRGSRRVEPLLGGASTSNLAAPAGPGGYGTLSGLCVDNATNAPLALSNAHVWGSVAGTEAIQPAFPGEFLGISLQPLTVGGSVIQSRIPAALVGPVALANSFSWVRAITGDNDDPTAVGQSAGSIPAAARTTFESERIQATSPSCPPAGRIAASTAHWAYRRESDAGVVESGSSQNRVNSDFLVVKRVWTDASSYSLTQILKIYAELLLPSSDNFVADAHFVVAHIYPPLGDRVFRRVLKGCPRQSFPVSRVSFTGFPAPATAGAAVMPLSVGDFQLDGDQPGIFINNPAGGLPANTVALRLSGAPVRIFTPPCTKVEIEIDLRGTSGSVTAMRFNAAGSSSTGVNVAPKGDGRSIATVEGSEITEVQLTAPGSAVLIGVAASRSSPEPSTVLLSYMASMTAAELGRGRWHIAAFVQRPDTGVTESANLVEAPTGAAALLADRYFDVT